jgi:hypothetical protein
VKIRPPELNDDFRDMLESLLEAEVEFVIVGAHALSVHGYPRATGDIDILVRPSAPNAARVMSALASFGVPTGAHGVSARDFTERGSVYQIGLPPRRIDLLTEISGVDFERARASQVVVRVAGLELPFLGRDALIANKRAAARPKDLVDADELERLEG